MTLFPSAVITSHARERLAERSLLSVPRLVQLLDCRLAKRVSVSKRRSHLVHRLYWSPADEAFYIAVQDVRNGAVLTVLTLEMFDDRYPGHVTGSLRGKVLNKSVLAGTAPKSRWHPQIKTKTYVAARLASAGQVGSGVLGQWDAVLPEPDVNAVGAMQQFWRWVLARVRNRGWPLEALEMVTLRFPFADDAPVPYLC